LPAGRGHNFASNRKLAENLLTVLAGEPNAAVVHADMREPETVLQHEETRRPIDVTKPVGLLLVGVAAVIECSRTAKTPSTRPATARSCGCSTGSPCSTPTGRSRRPDRIASRSDRHLSRETL
jgi:hypothetical protein